MKIKNFHLVVGTSCRWLASSVVGFAGGWYFVPGLGKDVDVIELLEVLK